MSFNEWKHKGKTYQLKRTEHNDCKGCAFDDGDYEDFIVSHQDRLAQIVFFHVEQVKFKTVKEFDTMTARGEGGFGSTGK